MVFFFFKQKTAYEMRISDWSQTCALPISRNALKRGGSEGVGQLADILGDDGVDDAVRLALDLLRRRETAAEAGDDDGTAGIGAILRRGLDVRGIDALICRGWRLLRITYRAG